MPALVPNLQITHCLSQSALSPPHHIQKAIEKSGVMAAAGAVHPQSWCSVQCTSIYAREIMSKMASCKQASSTAMMIVTVDGEADYGMPNPTPILRCHLRRRVLSLDCEEQHVII